MTESFDRARFVVHHLHAAGFELSLDGEVVVISPESRLSDSQHEMLVDHIADVRRFLACEFLVDQFLARQISDVKT